jgi:hypothetical protein
MAWWEVKFLKSDAEWPERYNTSRRTHLKAECKIGGIDPAIMVPRKTTGRFPRRARINCDDIVVRIKSWVTQLEIYPRQIKECRV